MYHFSAKHEYNVLMPSSGKERKINLGIVATLDELLLRYSDFVANKISI